MVLGKLNIEKLNNIIKLLFTSYTKINSILNKGFIITPKTIEKNEQNEIHKARKLLYSNRNSQQSEKTTYEIGKIFASHMSDKWQMPKIHNEFKSFNSKEI